MPAIVNLRLGCSGEVGIETAAIGEREAGKDEYEDPEELPESDDRADESQPEKIDGCFWILKGLVGRWRTHARVMRTISTNMRVYMSTLISKWSKSFWLCFCSGIFFFF